MNSELELKTKERTLVPVMNLYVFHATLKTGRQIAYLSQIASIVRKRNMVGRGEIGCPSELAELVPNKSRSLLEEKTEVNALLGGYQYIIATKCPKVGRQFDNILDDCHQ